MCAVYEAPQSHGGRRFESRLDSGGQQWKLKPPSVVRWNNKRKEKNNTHPSSTLRRSWQVNISTTDITVFMIKEMNWKLRTANCASMCSASAGWSTVPQREYTRTGIYKCSSEKRSHCDGRIEREGPRRLFTLVLMAVKTLCASLQMGLEQLAGVNRPVEQHHNTLWDVHLRQTHCDAKHLSQSCQKKVHWFLFFFVCGLVSIVGFERETKVLKTSHGGGFPTVNSSTKKINQLTWLSFSGTWNEPRKTFLGKQTKKFHPRNFVGSLPVTYECTDSSW